MKIMFSFTAVILLLSGCVATGINYKDLPAISSEKGTVFFLRQKKSVGFFVCKTVVVDEAEIGCLKNGGFFRVPVEPGLHTIGFLVDDGIFGSKVVGSQINIEVGKTYYFEYSPSFQGVCGAGVNSICMSFASNMYLIKEAAALKFLSDLNES